MKKKLVALISSIIALLMSISFLGGCNLVTVDEERDLNQIVATIQISDDAKVDKIFKKDLVMSYLNYGYSYESLYGYTREQVMNLIVNQTITTRVYIQNAVIQINDEDGIYHSIYEDVIARINADVNLSDVEKAEKVNEYNAKDTWDLSKYLNLDEEIDVVYSAKKQINSLIDNYVEKDELVGDTLTEELRIVPSNAANKEKELTPNEKKNYSIDTNSTTDRQKAFNSVIELLEANELLGDNFNGDILTASYYVDSLDSIRENKIIEKFEKVVTDTARSEIDFSDLEEVYAYNYSSQTDLTDAEFSEKLSSATIESPVLIGKGGSYGYVYNLLLGASETQTNAISKIKTTDISARAQERRTILADTIVKDLRSTWLFSGYDFDINTNKFTGDYAFLDDSFSFKGVVKELDGSNEDKKQYMVESLTEYSLDSFIAMMEEYIYGNDSDNTVVADANPSVYKKVNATIAKPNYDERINELLFAFSTDSGSLNTYKGYAIEPTPEDGKEKYMQEFATAGRELINMGGKSYVIVATDYGYHVMFYSQTFDNAGYETLVSYLNFVSGKNLDATAWAQELENLVAEWDDQEDNKTFLYAFFNSISTNRIDQALTKIQNKLLNDHVYNENGGVVRYPERYKDLMEV